jgi:hypothetical protein
VSDFELSPYDMVLKTTASNFGLLSERERKMVAAAARMAYRRGLSEAARAITALRNAAERSS